MLAIARWVADVRARSTARQVVEERASVAMLAASMTATSAERRRERMRARAIVFSSARALSRYRDDVADDPSNPKRDHSPAHGVGPYSAGSDARTAASFASSSLRNATDSSADGEYFAAIVRASSQNGRDTSCSIGGRCS